MKRLNSEDIVIEALKLLDKVGLEGLSTRRLAKRLGIESASLYWHFKSKSELLNKMSATALESHSFPVPSEEPRDWRDFVLSNARAFRKALLANRDGARLHAGSTPSASAIERILPKIEYLVRAGFTEHEAGMALYSASQFTIGCVLEEQTAASSYIKTTRKHSAKSSDQKLNAQARPGATEAFEFGMKLLVDGLERKLRRSLHDR